MKLLLTEHTKKLIEHGRATSAAQLEGLDEPDHMPVVKLFTPDANCTWLISELDPDDPDDMFEPFAKGGLFRKGSRLRRVRARLKRIRGK